MIVDPTCSEDLPSRRRASRLRWDNEMTPFHTWRNHSQRAESLISGCTAILISIRFDRFRGFSRS
jgi:hypothetical protein